MIYADETIISNLNAPLRQFTVTVELLKGSAVYETFTQYANIISILTERVGESKFFGYGVSQKTTIEFLDKYRAIDIQENDEFLISFDGVLVGPTLYVSSEITRDEKTSNLKVVAYDAINRASAITVEDLYLTSYTLDGFISAAAGALGASGVRYENIDLSEVELYYEDGANFAGTESLREALNGAANALQAIYYLDFENTLVFKRLDRDGEPVLTIGKESYFELTNKANRTINAICSATELGDNLTATMEDTEGLTCYIKDNPFWDLREDRATLVDNALAAVGGLSINEFDCQWRGNYLLEPGDKIALITKDDDTIYSYLLNDSYTYSGGLVETTSWQYDAEKETASNPTTIGEAINQTFARVDKVNREILLVADKAEDNENKLSELIVNTDGITTSVIETINDDIAELKRQASLAITEEDVKISIESEMANGSASKVATSTGFTFNDEGLSISKTDSEISTTITEDGMTVYKNDEAVLTANNQGVNAKDLHATTYLIVGNNSRFEDYTTPGGGKRTGCFWIGG